MFKTEFEKSLVGKPTITFKPAKSTIQLKFVEISPTYILPSREAFENLVHSVLGEKSKILSRRETGFTGKI